jgi:type II secretory pathway pseudopilin PulG
MLTLLLAIALMVILAGVIIPSITFDIKRDREEEMIHRGVQYTRAVRGYYRKFGRYPTKIEDLESANNLRFLRKRYKGPLSCKNGTCADFKLLHFGEVQMTLSAMGGGNIPGATPAGAAGGLNGGLTGGGPLSQPSGFGSSTGFGANSNSSFGQNQPAAGTQTGGQPAGTDSSQPGAPTGAQGTDATGSTSSGPGSNNSNSNQLGSGQIIGGPIVGVASTSKDTTIREFNHKRKYKDWAFVYDPAQDQGRLITTPYQPQLQGFGQQGTPNLNGQNGATNGSISGFGNNPSFGSGPMQNNPNSPAGGGFGQPVQPSNPPQQQ